MHANTVVSEPVENIFWKKPPAGVYTIFVKLYARRGNQHPQIPFRVLLKRDGEDDLSKEGTVANRGDCVTCFTFSVDDEGEIKVASTAAVASRAPMKASMKVAMKAPMKAPMKVSVVARGKKAMVKVWKGQKLKTQGGLKKGDLVKSRKGKIVSRKRSESSRASKWSKATAKAYALKGYTGFKPV